MIKTCGLGLARLATTWLDILRRRVIGDDEHLSGILINIKVGRADLSVAGTVNGRGGGRAGGAGAASSAAAASPTAATARAAAAGGPACLGQHREAPGRKEPPPPSGRPEISMMGYS